METFFWTLPVSNLYLWVLADGFGPFGGWPDCSLMVNLFGDQALKNDMNNIMGKSHEICWLDV